MNTLNEKNLELNPESNAQHSLSGTSSDIADFSLKSGLSEPMEKNCNAITQEKLFSYENSSISSEMDVNEEGKPTNNCAKEICLSDGSSRFIQDKDKQIIACEENVTITNSDSRCSPKVDEIISGQITCADNQTSISSRSESNCCPSVCDETLHPREESASKKNETLVESSAEFCSTDGQLILPSGNLLDEQANNNIDLPAFSTNESVMTDLPDSSIIQSNRAVLSVGVANPVNELPNMTGACDSSNNNNSPHKKLCSIISEPSTESLSPEPNDGSADVSDFQPVILDVRGSCNENLLSCPTDIQESYDSCSNSVEQLEKVSDKFLETMESIPKSAMEMLRGIIQLNQLNQSKKTPQGGVTANSADCSSDTFSPELLNEASETVISKPGYLNRLLQNDGSESSSNLLSQVPTNKPDGSDRATPQMASLTRFPFVAEQPHRLTVNRIPVTCVLVQDTNSVSSNQVTLLIGKPGLLQPRNTMGIEESNKNNQILSTGIVTDNALNGAIINAENTVPSAPTKLTTIEDRIANLVDKTIENFVMKGKDLENSSILKMLSTSELEAIKHSDSSVQCFICGECYHNDVSLTNHFKRTVFHLLYECPSCTIGIVFHNKCDLGKHLRNHRRKLEYDNILQFKPYEVPKKQTEDMALVSTADIASLNTRNKNPDQISKVLTLPLLPTICGVNAQERGRSECLLRCSMCNLVHPQVTQGKKPQASVDKTAIQSCPSCGMSFPSLCSLKAHIRLHTKIVNNMICPECGHITLRNSLSIDDMKKAAFDHMDECKHFNRVVVLSCLCKEEFTLVKQLAYHFMTKHLKKLYKCKFCLIAFTQYDHLLNHVKIIHQRQDLCNESNGVHLVCVYCQQLMKNAKEAKIHVEGHVLNQIHKAVFKWKCFLCSQIFESKEKLSEHSEFEHPHKPKRCMICFSLFCSRQNLVDHIMLKKCKLSTPMIYDQCVDIEQNLQLPELNYAKLFAPSKPFSPWLSTKFIKISTIAQSNRKESNCQVEKSIGGVPQTSSEEQSKNTETYADSPNADLGIQKNVSSPGKGQSFQHLTIRSGEKSATVIQTGQESQGSEQEIPCTVTKIVKKFFSCQVCRQKFPARNYYNSHMRSHEKKGQWKPNEKCDVCEMRLEISFLESHLKEHQAEGVIICSSCQSREFQNMEEAMRHPDTGCVLKRKAVLENSIQPFEKTSLIQKSPSENNISKEIEKGVDVNETDEKKLSVFPCLLCGLAFHSMTMREKHVSRMHDGTRIVYQCLKCKKKKMSKVVFLKKESVIRHLIKRHRILKMETVEKFIGIEEQNATSGHSLEHIEFVDSDDSSAPPPKRLRIAENGDYMCGKCGFSTSDSGEFCTHIATHNANNEPQCPECGLCFTVVPALMKHLFAVHKIRAVEEFLKSKNITMPQFESEEVMEDAVFPVPTSPLSYSNPISHKSSPQNPLECTVCYKVLESESNLRTHMRNHGMAFIRSKRLQNIEEPNNKD